VRAAETTGYGSERPATEIHFWYMPNGPEPERSMAAEVASFQEVHPNIKVTATLLDWSQALIRLSTAAAGGDGPDVTQLGTTWVGGITAQGALHAFTDRELDGIGGRQPFLPASWTATRLVGRTETTAVPWFIDTRALVYRTDVLSRLGLDPTAAFATWESLDRTLAQIKTEGKVSALGQPGKDDWNVVHNLAPFIWGAGGDLLSADGADPMLGTAASVDGVDYYQRLVANYNAPGLLTKNTNDAVEAFADGSVAVSIQNPDVIRRFRADSARPGLQAGWATAPLPVGPKGRFTFLGGSNLSIWGRTDHHDAAYEWVRFLTGRDSQSRYAARTAGVWPARSAAIEDTPMSSDPAYRAFTDTLADGKQYPAVATWTDIEAMLQKDFSLIWDTVLTTSAPMPRDQLQQLMTRSDGDVRDVIRQAT